jgi:hypothetical protein
MRKREIIHRLREIMQGIPKQALGNLLDSWEGRTPKLYCEPDLVDCVNCLFPEDRICDDKECDGRVIFDSKVKL